MLSTMMETIMKTLMVMEMIVAVDGDDYDDSLRQTTTPDGDDGRNDRSGRALLAELIAK